jgi:hypothetical protein
MQLRKRSCRGTDEGEGIEESQRGTGREQYERKPWLLERHGEKLNK